jgi:hypothetical protein
MMIHIVISLFGLLIGLWFGLGLFLTRLALLMPTIFTLVVIFMMMTVMSPIMMTHCYAQTRGGNERDCHAQDPFGSSVHVDSIKIWSSLDFNSRLLEIVF